MHIFRVILFTFVFINLLQSQPLQEFRAVKLTNVDSDVMFSDKNIAEAMDYLADIGINTILVVVWNSNGADGDYTLYPSAVMDNYFGKSIHPSFRNRDPLHRVIIEAHRNGMEVLPWFEMGFSTSYSQNGGHILNRYPNWALQDINGNLVVKNGFDWMSPVNPEVHDFMLSLAVEVADNYDIDGIEYSDRIPAMPVEGGYDSVTVSIYRQEHDGNDPPIDHKDAAWMRWRADKLSLFFKNVRDSIKKRSAHLIVSSSPSLYPWSYQEYLQDSKTWILEGIADNIIPQLYRYNYNDYLFELNKSLNNFPGYENIYYAGMLIKLGSYVIDPAFFLNSIAANRNNNVYGEAFFFYEGLRANNDQLGDTLKATWYAQPALIPDRQGNIWRPKAIIVNEDDPGADAVGSWQESGVNGFFNGILINTAPDPASITYSFDVPYAAWFDVFVYNVTGQLTTEHARVIVYAENDSSVVTLNQKDGLKSGWQPVGSVYMDAGTHRVVKLSNQDLASGEKLTADAAMIMINRKKSPDVIVTGIDKKENSPASLPHNFILEQNYPNPFNPATTIRWHLKKSGKMELIVYNMLGQKVATLVKGVRNTGNHQVTWNASDQPSGMFFYRLITEYGQDTKKMLLLR